MKDPRHLGLATGTGDTQTAGQAMSACTTIPATPVTTPQACRLCPLCGCGYAQCRPELAEAVSGRG